jgi:hypothetical protein
MMAVADGSLRDLGNQGLGITQHQQQQLTVAVKFFFDVRPG